MRFYIQKPRTILGWTGFLEDPDLDGSYNINKGIEKTRETLVKINSYGLYCATEFLGTTISPQYFDDLITFGCIGARTVESQIHRQLASGLSCPIGFKNSTSGNIKVAQNAIKSANAPHGFLGINKSGELSFIHTNGNPNCCLILRGGGNGPNYDKIRTIKEPIIVDCSHGNSNKCAAKQKDVVEAILYNRPENLKGLMLESNLESGRQDITPILKYGVSITDECIGWKDTEIFIRLYL